MRVQEEHAKREKLDALAEQEAKKKLELAKDLNKKHESQIDKLVKQQEKLQKHKNHMIVQKFEVENNLEKSHKKEDVTKWKAPETKEHNDSTKTEEFLKADHLNKLISHSVENWKAIEEVHKKNLDTGNLLKADHLEDLLKSVDGANKKQHSKVEEWKAPEGGASPANSTKTESFLKAGHL